jgi:hypothetical protein
MNTPQTIESLGQIFIASIAAGLLAAVVSFIGLNISKEQKISEFRQKWIDDLREDISLIIGLANGRVIHSHFSDKLPKDEKLHGVEITQKLHEATARIALRLNPREGQTQNLMSALMQLDRACKVEDFDMDKVTSATLEVVGASSEILKVEWKRVKRGELTYQIVKWSSLLISISIVIAAYCLLRK